MELNWKFASNCKWCTISYPLSILPFVFLFVFESITYMIIGYAFLVIFWVLHWKEIIPSGDKTVVEAYVFTKSSLRNATKETDQ